MKDKKYNIDKIRDLLRGDNSDKAVAVCMIRQHMSLGETVKLLVDIFEIRAGSLPEMIILAIYPLPLYLSKGGVKNLTFKKIKEWAVKSPNVRPARNKFEIKMTKNALERYLEGYSTSDVYLQMLGHG
jgi:hypothetical protein